MTGVTVIILTYNEQIHIARAIESAKSFADEILVIDSHSKDQTKAISLSLGAKVYENQFINQAAQFQWALDNVPISNEWILRLDADELVEPDLAARIIDVLPSLPADVTGVNFDRKHIFLERWIRHGGRYPLTMLRLFRRGIGRIEQRWMDEHIFVESGRTVHFSGGFADHNLNDLTYFIDKHNKYATREAVDVINRRHQLFDRDQELSSHATSFQASAKRFIKENIYNRIPFPVSTLGYFLYRYIIQLGFLDGREGLIYHFLQGYWYRFLVGAKIMELERGLAGHENRQEKLDVLARMTGLRLLSGPEDTV